MEELSCLFNKASFITEMDEMSDMEIENIGKSARRRSLPALIIPQTERLIQDTHVEGDINYLLNSDATEDVNEVSAVRTRKQISI